MKRLACLLLVFTPPGWAGDLRANVTGTSTLSLLQVSLSLVIVLIAIFSIAWLARRVMPAHQSNGVLRIVGGVHLSNRERVVVLEIGEQWVVVGVTPNQVSALHTLPRQEINQTATQATDFSRHLLDRLTQWKKAQHDARQ